MGTDRSNDETKGPVDDLYELPPKSLVLKTLRAAKSNVVDPGGIVLLLTALLFRSEPEQVLSWFVGLGPYQHDRDVPESLLPHRGLLYCICNCGALWPMENIQ